MKADYGRYLQRLRKRLVTKQGGKCCYCRRPFTVDGPARPTLEHRKARMDGGKDKISNLAAACLYCNHDRGRKMNSARQKARRLKRPQITKAVANVTEPLTVEMIAPSTVQFYRQLSLDFDEPSPKPD